VTDSGNRRVGPAGGCPTIRAGIVFAAAVWNAISTPNDHFSAGPECPVTDSGNGRVGPAGSCPTIRAGIVFAAAVWNAISTPNDHFTAGPHCRVTVSGNRGISDGCSHPRIISARVGNFGKSVDNLPKRCNHRHRKERVALRGFNLPSLVLR